MALTFPVCTLVGEAVRILKLLISDTFPVAQAMPSSVL